MCIKGYIQYQMSTELAFFRFLKKLPDKERNLYLWLNCYREVLVKFNNAEEHVQKEVETLMGELFEPEINKVIELGNISAKQVSVPNEVKYPNLAQADIKFDEKLGSWGSSFSDEESEPETEITFLVPPPPPRSSSLTPTTEKKVI